MNSINQQTVSIDDCQLNILEAGTSGKQSIILLHGKKFQAQTWQELGTLDILSEENLHSLAVDMPGFGKSPACSIGPSTILKKVIKQKNLVKPILLGPSMGGRMSLEFCLNNGELLSGLILVGSVGVQENKHRLSSITLPCLMLWGGDDAISSVENGHLLEKEIKESKLVVFAGAPHPCYLQETKSFHQEIISFIQKIA